MYIIPAIDLRDGKCVRLIQGQYHRQINYKDNPVEQAVQFIDEGSEWLHIIDLDGAKIGKCVNLEAIESIIKLGKLKIEVGGGIRDEDTIAQLLDLGIERVIIGTRAVSDFDWFGQMIEKFPRKLVISIDARGSKVATHGWTQDSPAELLDFAAKAAQLDINAIIYTDITKDGMLSGPNFDRTKALVDAVDTPIIAAGGVTSTEDIRKLAEIGTAAAIIGRSLYEGSITLPDALNAVR